MVIIVSNTSTIQKLLHIYLTELGIVNNQYSHKELITILKSKFNFEVTERDIALYYEPNTDEETTDLTLQLKNIYGQ
jgi:lipoprotein NlpI